MSQPIGWVAAPDAYVRRILTNTFLTNTFLSSRRPLRVTRERLILRYYEDLSERQIADALGCSTGTVQSNLVERACEYAVAP